MEELINLDIIKLSKELDFIFKLLLDKECELSNNLNWKRLLNLVEKNRIQPLFANKLRKKFPNLDNSNEFVAKFLDKSKSFSWICMHQVSCLGDIISSFNDVGIRTLLYKGPVVAKKLYGDISLRYSRDLDIWVDPKRLWDAVDILEKKGWHTIPQSASTKKRFNAWKKHMRLADNKHFEFFNKKINDVIFELHWRTDYWKDEDFNKIWENRSYVTLTNVKMACLDETNDAFATIIHNAQHAFFRLRWLFDTYFIIKKYDISLCELWNLCIDYGVEVFLLASLIFLMCLPYMELNTIDFKVIKLQKGSQGVKIQYIKKYDNLVKESLQILDVMKAVLEEQIEDPYETPIYKEFQDKYIFSVIKKDPRLVVTNIFAPKETEWEKWDLPDSLYFLYYPLRLYNWVLRKTPFFGNPKQIKD